MLKYGVEILKFNNGDESKIPVTSTDPNPRSFYNGGMGYPPIEIRWFDTEAEMNDFLERKNDSVACCGECRFHRYQDGDWLCTNPQSEFGGHYTDYDDYCEEGEER